MLSCHIAILYIAVFLWTAAYALLIAGQSLAVDNRVPATYPGESYSTYPGESGEQCSSL